jgi:hypothetical protein
MLHTLLAHHATLLYVLGHLRLRRCFSSFFIILRASLGHCFIFDPILQHIHCLGSLICPHVRSRMCLPHVQSKLLIVRCGQMLSVNMYNLIIRIMFLSIVHSESGYCLHTCRAKFRLVVILASSSSFDNLGVSSSFDICHRFFV